MWGTLIRCCLRFVQWRNTRNPVKDRDPNVYGQMEPSNTSLQTTDLNPNYSGQTNSNKPGSGQWVVFSSNDNSSNDTSSTSFCLTTFGPISKKRSLVKGTLTLILWSKSCGRSVVGRKVCTQVLVIGMKVRSRDVFSQYSVFRL